MPIEVLFPKRTGQMYYEPHFLFVKHTLAFAGCHIQDSTDLDIDRCVNFYCVINGKKIGFNCSDDPVLGIWDTDVPIFKFHKSATYNFGSNIHAFSPISFDPWSIYSDQKTINYTCSGNTILNNQRISGGAIERRTIVAKILATHFGSDLDRDLTSQMDFWDKFNRCLVSVCVPGYCNNMVDRGHLQSLAFGVCTISPNLPEIFPFDRTLVPNQHYIRCNDDYSDLIEKIEWCKNNREKCIQIGKEAKTWFLSTCTPEYLLKWILSHI